MSLYKEDIPALHDRKQESLVINYTNVSNISRPSCNESCYHSWSNIPTGNAIIIMNIVFFLSLNISADTIIMLKKRMGLLMTTATINNVIPHILLDQKLQTEQYD